MLFTPEKMESILLTIVFLQLVVEVMRTWREVMQFDLVVRPNCM